MGSVGSDVRQALGMVRTSPGFTAAVVAAVAIGIGTTTAIFSVVNAVVLKRVPFPEPDRIVRLLALRLTAYERPGVSSGMACRPLRR